MKKSVWYLVGVLILVLALVAVACAKPAEKPAAPAAPTPPATAPAPAPAPPPTEKTPAPAGGTIHQVTIKNFAFSPAQITIKVGDTVTWTNRDSAPHTATGSGFKSGNLANGQSWSYTFKTVGTSTYKCTIHPSILGQVTVENGGASQTPAPPPTPVPPPTEKALAPASFTTSNLTISPTEVDTGKSVTISVLVTNSGGLTASYKVTLKIDNVAVATQDVTLSGGASQTVTFVTTKDVAGTYTVNIDGLSATFTVKTAPAPSGGGGSGDYGY